jgi:NAD(P)-dependent dehydrogenase (short-subunit alcohol dehydrogenase family)
MSRKAPKSLVGSVVAITGGARGIGRATAAALLAQGCRVAIGDIDVSLVEQTAAELGRGAVGLRVDVTDRASFDGFLTEVESRLGPLDVLVNNAGIMPVGPFVEETDAVAARMVDINLHGVIFGSKLALERFLPRRSGHLVNVASTAGKSGFPGGATYCATKHAVVGLSETIRSEVAGAGINVSIVMPILVNTELGNGFPEVRGFKLVEPEDVANEIVDALRFTRVDVYVPRRVGPVLRSQQVLPRRLVDWIAHVLHGDQVLAKPDHTVRAAYEARIAETVALGAAGSESGAPGAGEDEPAVHVQ